MLNDQQACATLLVGLFELLTGSLLTENGIHSTQSNPTSVSLLRAVHDYATAMEYCREEILQELDILDHTIIQPTEQAVVHTKTIQKTIVKRQHKLLDFDRFKLSHQKYAAIADKSPSEEKHMCKLETQLETATHDYHYLNDILIRELGGFLYLSSELIRSLHISFYSLQCRMMGGLYGRIHQVTEAYLTVLPTYQQSIVAGYQWRIDQQSVEQSIRCLSLFQKESSASRNVRSDKETLQPTTPSVRSAHSRPPPPKPRLKPSVQYAIALYDLEAQQQGDLTLCKNDRIEIIEKTPDTMGWWKGRLGNDVGMFPGNSNRNRILSFKAIKKKGKRIGVFTFTNTQWYLGNYVTLE
ncbi:hypothetical protein BDF14DRAFT_1720786 [Spinellus fusiger]|nr:hypothetical protein BDF14DRAFT_1739306 [Spinellus fusiger]KAI7870583.1 hypothetical protein BDF14DRAFT_1720786 [Spinellus fusiger]